MRLLSFFLLLFSLYSCREQNTLFRQIPASQSGISFNNQVTENDTINSLDMEFLYNGGGVAVGDFNRDSLPDLYFTASQLQNKLYLNKGKLKFEDITTRAGVEGNGRWSNAASVVDINNDGWQDIYVCATIHSNPDKRANLLYINQGPDGNGIPRFREMAKDYNLADTGMSVHAAFFDYDRDGDLDVYIVTTKLAQRNSTRFDGSTMENTEPLCDKLYRNEGSDSLGHPWFREVGKDAGIRDEGYGLGIAVSDINKDGWKDIYVTNDFYGSDLLYINNGDGTFSDKAKICFKHTSQNAMGNDIADINNDGLPDIIAVDMNPEDNYRKKKNMNGGNYFVYNSFMQNGLITQQVRNTLQLNNGLFAFDTTDQLLPSFSDISFYAGVAETDWSWNPSLADFDNDGWKDLIITNGYPRDVTDHDFAAFRANSAATTPKKELLGQIPQIKVANYAYRNKDGLRFEKVTTEWGLDQPSFSDGAVYVDLDRDGDLDYVINNINEEAFVYRNESQKMNGHHFLQLRFEGAALNPRGIGASATVYAGGLEQSFENSPYRGYLSTVDDGLHFGLGKQATVDSVIVTWPDGKVEVLRDIKADRTIYVQYKEAVEKTAPPAPGVAPLFANITAQSGITYRHQEFDFIDFNQQKLLPHKLSQYGPSIAAGDIDNNGFDDFIVGASADNLGSYFLQQPNGKFTEKELPAATGADARRPEMMGLLLFDADGDGDLDLYAASGSNEYAQNTKSYQDQFYLNTGGTLVHLASAIPKNFTSKSCVKAADFDGDGDLDLFIGGRVQPERYPEPVSSFIYRNDTKDGKVVFTDITSEVAPALNKVGLVCDAIWTDFDNDGWQDLIVVGEWMPVSFLKNNKGILQKQEMSGAIRGKTGWWNSITGGDFDNDGDMDYVVGNLGLNSFFRASEKEPVSIYAGDLDDDPSYDAIPTLYLPGEKDVRKEYPANVRDEVIKQMIIMRRRFPLYKDFAEADIHALLSEPLRQKAMVLKANYFESCYMQNNGNGNFELKPLPPQAQWAPLNGMVAEDVNGDGMLDLLLAGNDYGNEVVNGRYDAMNGLILLGDGKGNFKAAAMAQSGFFLPGDTKGLVKLMIGGRYCIAATQNRDRLELFTLGRKNKFIRPRNDESVAIVHLKNGATRKTEIPYGHSFLSQSSRFLVMDDSILSVTFINNRGQKRTVQQGETPAIAQR
jgi:hypothetical protein